jgi:hypothetical protein
MVISFQSEQPERKGKCGGLRNNSPKNIEHKSS